MIKMTTEEKTELIEKYRGKSLVDLRPDLAVEWHPTKNGDLMPEMVSAGSHKKTWWLLPYDDENTGKHFDFEWEARVYSRTEGKGCPYVTGRSVWSGYNDLATTNPELAAQWHPTKNEKLTPQMVSSGLNLSVWWYLPYDDNKTGKHYDFEWKAAISNRTKGNGCPFLSGRAVWTGFNDLATTNPELADQWHPTKNKKLTPQMVSANSNEKVWWYLSYTDYKTCKRFDFEWEAQINSRTNGAACPYLTNHSVWPGFNDLATTNPNLAAEWHPTRNGDLTPQMVFANSNKKVWWLLSYNDPKTGKCFNFEWKATVNSRNGSGKCPFLYQTLWVGFNDLATTNPDIAKEWHPTKNGKLTPCDVMAGTDKKVWWKCSNGHEWVTSIHTRNCGCGCPHCRVFKGEKRIFDFFDKHNVKFYEQYKFDDCIHKRKLPFDGAVFNKDGTLAFLVEYDGEQHFRPVDFSGKGSGKETFRLCKTCDKIKNEYCRKNKVPLVRISYKDYDNIEKILLKKLVRYGLM